MKILRNYILREFFGPFIFSLSVLTFVMLLGSLVKLADLIITKGVSIVSVGKLFLYMIPFLLMYTLPIAILSGTVMALGRLSSDNEMIAIRASGINPFRLISPILVLSFIFSLFLVILNDRIIPEIHYASRKTVTDIGIKNPAAALEEGTFINSFEKYVLFIYHIEQNKLSGVRIYEPQENRPTRTIVAKRGEFITVPEKNIVKLKLMDGSSDEPDPQNPNRFYKLNFKTYFMNLNLLSAQNKQKIDKKPKDMSIHELRTEIKKYISTGIKPNHLITEIHKKLSMAFSCFIFVLVGCPLAIIARRREKAINFGISFLVVLVYYMLYLGFEALSLQGIILPQIGMWIANIVLGIVGIFLMVKLCVS
ncbi:MAG: LptF/LptG family permease [Candidatus Omnitrophota bacterium]